MKQTRNYTVKIVSHAADRDSRRELIAQLAGKMTRRGNLACLVKEPKTTTTFTFESLYNIDIVDVVELDYAPGMILNRDDMLYIDVSSSDDNDNSAKIDWAIDTIRPPATLAWYATDKNRNGVRPRLERFRSSMKILENPAEWWRRFVGLRFDVVNAIQSVDGLFRPEPKLDDLKFGVAMVKPITDAEIKINRVDLPAGHPADVKPSTTCAHQHAPAEATGNPGRALFAVQPGAITTSVTINEKGKLQITYECA